MLLFSSRDRLTLPGICLWVLITTIRLHCSYAFDILTHKNEAPFSSVPSSASSFSTSSSLPSSTSSPLSPPSSSFLSSSSSPKLNVLFPNKLYSHYYRLRASMGLPTPSVKRSINVKSSHTSHIIKRAISTFIPHLPSSEENLIPFSPENDDGRDRSEQWSTKIPIMISSQPQELRQPLSAISSIKEKQKLKSYFERVEKMKTLKSMMRRRMKEKAILKAKMSNKNRLTKMESVEAMALAKSPPKTQISRSIKARRADYFVQNHHAQPGGDGSRNIDLSPSGSFVNGFGGGNHFVNPENAGVFPGFELGKDSIFIPSGTGGFTLDQLPQEEQVDFVINNGGGFVSPNEFLPQPLPPPSPSSSSAHQKHFAQFPPQSGQDSFGPFLDVPQQESGTWQSQPPFEPHQQDGFDLFSPSDSPSPMPTHVGGFFLPASNVEPSLHSNWGQVHASSPIDGDDGGFVSGFESFPKNDNDCPDINTKVCRSSRDCECNGVYRCMGTRCVRKGPVNAHDNDPIGGVWHEAPAFDTLMPQTRIVHDKE